MGVFGPALAEHLEALAVAGVATDQLDQVLLAASDCLVAHELLEREGLDGLFEECFTGFLH